jgi:hypothetical protein
MFSEITGFLKKAETAEFLARLKKTGLWENAGSGFFPSPKQDG